MRAVWRLPPLPTAVSTATAAVSTASHAFAASCAFTTRVGAFAATF